VSKALLRERSIVVVLVILAAGLTYVLLSPLYCAGVSVLKPRNLESMADAKDYYAIASSVFGMLVALFGLVVGYFYYSHRNEEDSRRAQIDRFRDSVRHIAELLDEYELQVCEIVSVRMKDEESLRFARQRLTMVFDHVYPIVVEENRLKMDRDEMRQITALHSFVDNEFDLMRCPFEELKNRIPALAETGYAFGLLLQDARRALYARLWEEGGHGRQAT
jgi:hypothetical protein